ncbi:Rpn family recombination-promoting nuclease/putative transposase [Limnoglobus roseus]|uniref:DUF4351 domain-containing protein n=1 Tax=Limnoglobus roseus TaxID=2598579 RepID=A0A5C1AFU2_9BACT|nr:Rpn family recombination-promoting nuclease/putative transposase [Limnoglobus roseus]QEL16014.1 hypothetical protein PX52LOC_02952 [Limnoglobus roseus]
MAKPFDATLKRMLDDYAADWAAWLAARFGLPVGPLVPVESDLSTIQPAADKVFRLPGDAGLLHLEVQSSWDGELPDRMLLYNALLYHRERVPVRSVAILLRREANATAITGEVSRSWTDGQPYHWFRYEVIRLWEQPADQLLAGGIGTAPLGLLTDDAEDRLSELIHQFVERVERDVPGEAERDQVLTASYILLGMRYDRELIRTLFSGVQKMRESSTYQAILDEGRAEGELQGEIKGEIKGVRLALTTLLESRFGSIPQAVEDRIQSATGLDRLRAALIQVATITRPEDLVL